MSYDYALELDGGGPEPATIEPDTVLWNFRSNAVPAGGRTADVASEGPGSNYTSNVSKMWRAALGRPLYEFNGMLASKALPELEAGIRAMEANPAFYERMNPSNGWGSYQGALAYIEGMAECCRRFPKAVLRISS